MATSQKLTQIATNIVLEKALKDKFSALKQQNAAQQQQQQQQGGGDGSNAADEGEDEDFDDLSHWREKRIKELKAARAKQTALKEKGHGEYTEIQETDFLGIVTKTPKVVCHFYSPRFERCRIMDKHLEILAKVHIETRFIKLNAEKSPFFTNKLRIYILPTLVLFINGVSIHSILGFNELGGKDNFFTNTLAKLLLKYNIIDNVLKQIHSSSEESEEEDK